ncbi:uncharacterized protein B0H18DRAFT_981990 [Fomitopsis serialis]|uniref:uncharacterized protein n=1 Tax=Fomitopsis serialis TaxID=139415 RepID=UPI002008E603|nr:uncharacterized protein B0H18DRAFT_981990 [Neoantrodia serialis]KAH9933786.1 hypothetical protein B0H18DRAFT_981990 [Neoantrodia serialis]
MTAVPNPVFKFNREMHTIRVENIAESASVQDIVDLFTTLIGEVRKCEELKDGSRRVLGLTFLTHDATKKALCMSGYTVAGVPLTVTAVSHSEAKNNAKQGKQSDARRNLYVLGLPFELTKSEFVEIFSRYGTVSHAVILATVDNASRRRGFVVMSTFSEARAAMDGLSRKEIKGHTIDVSWAVVQRSQGFLDGGDRTTALGQSPPSTPSPYEFRVPESSPTSAQCSLRSTPVPEQGPMNMLSVQPASLLVSNLPAVLFSEMADLYPLFCPFGEIKNLEILDSSVAALDRGDISVRVEYETLAQAEDAYSALQGQMYSSKPVKVEFTHKPTVDFPLFAGKDLKARLNPNAAPFVAPAGMPHDTLFAPVASLCARPDQDRIATALPNGLLAVNPYALSQYATPPSLYTQLYVPVAGTVRPSSAPSWSEPTPDRRPGHWAFAQLDRLSNMSTPSLGQTFT